LAAQQTRHSHNADAGPQNERRSASDSPFVSDNYYTLLNIPYDASARDITKAYRQAMMRAHPDRVLPERRAAAEDLSKLLNRAYSTLSDPRKRLAYDRSIRADVVQVGIMNRYVGGPAGPGMGGAVPSAPAPRRPMTERERRDRRRSDRSAMLSILSAFAVVAIGAIGLMVLFALASLAISLIF
jgi:curved DNA-binding protein CbpA